MRPPWHQARNAGTGGAAPAGTGATAPAGTGSTAPAGTAPAATAPTATAPTATAPTATAPTGTAPTGTAPTGTGTSTAGSGTAPAGTAPASTSPASTGSPPAGGRLGAGRRRRGSVTLPSVVAGLLMALSLPPWGWWPLAFVGAAVFCWRIDGLRARARLAAGWALGIGMFVPGLWWALSFNVYGGIVLMAAEALAPALGALAVPPRRGRVLALPAAMVLAEWLRDTAPFGGLPMGSVALGQAAGPLAVAARLGGPLLLVGLTWLVGSGLAALAEAAVAARHAGDGRRLALRERPRPPGTPQPPLRATSRLLAAGAAALLAVVAVVVAAGLSPDGGPDAGTVRVASVQGGGRRGVSQAEVAASTVFAAQLAATAAIPAHDGGHPPTLVVWPEDVVALPGPLAGSPARAVLQATARRLHASMVVGVTEDVGATHFRNEAVALSPSGAVLGHYEKVHRVPFGEYVPDRGFFSHLANLSAVPRDAIPGHGDGILATPAARLGTMISFEVFFSGRGRDPVRHGADLLVVPTNTSSYVTSQVPSQEIAADRLQAIAEGRYLVQAAPTGYSDVVTPNGTVLGRSPLGRRSVVVADVALRHGLTAFARGGSLPVGVAAAAAVAAAWAADVGRRRRSARPAD